MSKFTSTNRINTRWRGNDFVGGLNSSHTFPNELHDEFLVDWAYQIGIGTVIITETPTTGNIQVATLTVGDIVLTGTATGSFGGVGTVVQGTAPISISTTSNTSTVSVSTGVTSATVATGNHLHTSTYQPFGTYVTSVAGTAPISASTTTAGAATVSVSTGVTSATVALGSHLHTGVYQDVGSYAETVHTHATSSITSGNFAATVTGGTGVTVTGGTGNASTPSIAIGQAVATSSVPQFKALKLTEDTDYSYESSTNGELIYRSDEGFRIMFNQSGTEKQIYPDNQTYSNAHTATATATTITSTTSSSPTDMGGLTVTFTPTYNENVIVQANLVFTQTVAPTATVDIISRIIVSGTIASPKGGFTRLTSGHSSPTGFNQSISHTFSALASNSYTVKVGAYRSVANGTFGSSTLSSLSIIRVRA